MARVTVEDCVLKVPNRFELVMLAAQRARDVSSGAALTVDRDNDKNPVVALREIADETINLQALENALVQGLQKHVEVDEPEDEEIALLAAEEMQAMPMDEEIREDMLSVQEEPDIDEAIEDEIKRDLSGEE